MHRADNAEGGWVRKEYPVGYYMRYIVDEDKAISLDIIETALKRVDASYNLAAKDQENEHAELMLGTDLYGELEINRRGTELMDEEFEELLEDVEEAEGEGLQKVQNLLRDAHFTVVVRVLWQGREAVETLEKIDPLWEWLFGQYSGLLQADGEGYYDENGQILEVK